MRRGWCSRDNIITSSSTPWTRKAMRVPVSSGWMCTSLAPTRMAPSSSTSTKAIMSGSARRTYLRRDCCSSTSISRTASATSASTTASGDRDGRSELEPRERWVMTCSSAPPTPSARDSPAHPRKAGERTIPSRRPPRRRRVSMSWRGLWSSHQPRPPARSSRARTQAARVAVRNECIIEEPKLTGGGWHLNHSGGSHVMENLTSAPRQSTTRAHSREPP